MIENQVFDPISDGHSKSLSLLRAVSILESRRRGRGKTPRGNNLLRAFLQLADRSPMVGSIFEIETFA
jgi:hypothetical protein